ncbi:MAG: hypothetical protein WCA35_18955 [Kovacikia sp.]
MAHALHSTHSHLVTVHQNSMMASLTHRLEVARAANNVPLIEQLERERQEIISTSMGGKVSRALTNWFKTFQEKISHAIAGNSKLEVYQFENGSDLWWYAFDPRTGDCVYADSESDMRLWIEENYQGK